MKVTTSTPLIPPTTRTPSFCERHSGKITLVAAASLALTALGLLTGTHTLLIPGAVTLLPAGTMYCRAITPSSDTPKKTSFKEEEPNLREAQRDTGSCLAAILQGFFR